MSPIDFIVGALRTPDYVLDLQQQESLDDYRRRVSELSRVDELSQILEMMRVNENLQASREKLENTREFVRFGEQAMRQELTRRADETDYKYRVLRREFTPAFHEQLADHIALYPDTFNALLNKVEMADTYQDELEGIQKHLEAYTWVMSYLNNFDCVSAMAAGDEATDNSDVETFLTHREFGLVEATKLLATIRNLNRERFVVSAESDAVVVKWSQLEFPVKNINGTVHRKVKKTSDNF